MSLKLQLLLVVVKQEKGKSLAFKAYKEEEESSTDSEDNSDDEIALLTRRFSKFLKFNKCKTGSPFGSKKSSIKIRRMTQFQDASDVNSKKHLKADCPLLKSESGKQKEVAKFKDKEAHYATWGESDAEMLSSDEEDTCFKNGVCFMAGTSKVSSPETNLLVLMMSLLSIMLRPVDNIYDAYDELVS